MPSAKPDLSVGTMVLLGPDEVCEMIPNMSTAKLAQLRFKGMGPAYMRPTPKTIVYEKSEILSWLLSTARTSTAEAA